MGSTISGLSWKLPPELDKTFADTLETWRTDGCVRRLWAHDASLWTGDG